MKVPEPAPTLYDVLNELDLNADLPRILAEVPSVDVGGEYVHWEDIRKRPTSGGLSRKAQWAGLKFRRTNIARPLPLKGTDGRAFQYGLTDAALELLHWVDQHAAGEILVTEGITDEGQRRRYLVNSLMEESITSSQLEGAAVTRKVAKEMLRSGRNPRDRGERMILNNYRAMSRLHELSQQAMDRDLVLELHSILTDGTLDDPSAAGRIQTDQDERVRVYDWDNQLVHVPPPASELEDRLAMMIRFANGEIPDSFIHPVIRAILLHLWLAYDHPFEDGNGRTARALFYWAMLHRGYWMFEYLSISSLLVKGPAQYARAFLYTETDELDATYFVHHQLRVIRRAVDQLMETLRRQVRDTQQTIRMLRETDLNHRQVALLTHALKQADYEYTIQAHAQSHGVTRQSARTDLLDLERKGFLIRRTVGRKFFFYPADDLSDRVTAKTARNSR